MTLGEKQYIVDLVLQCVNDCDPVPLEVERL